ncbi:MAG TPA: DUF6298 domain-containing protein [Opitutus sp.]|nr:DUF6298 domain-containing protein [Opitutus sp.]
MLFSLLCVSRLAVAAGNQIPLDFSSAGYEQGGKAIPSVPARFRAAISSGGDDTAAIQSALDAAAALPMGADGFRGAVALQPGTYHVAGQLVIKASGVVLRGNGSTLVATGHSRRTLIVVQGRDDRALGEAHAVTDERVPVGAVALHVESVEGLAPGRRVVVQRPSTQAWISALSMNQFIGPSTRWTNFKKQRLDWWPGTRDIEWERTIVAIDPATHTLTLDAPLTTALEKRYGGGTVRTIAWPGRLNHVGVENLACVSEFAGPIDEEHAWMGVSLDHVENAWVRNVTARHFVCSVVWIGAGARAVTVEDCVSREPVSALGGWRRVSFFVGGQQVLVQRCTADEGRCDFVMGHCAAGPNVFLDCRATRSHGDSGSFESWASGTLYDNVIVDGAALGLVNLGEARQGAGWAAANSVAWNCFATGGVIAEEPPDAPNFAVTNVTERSLYCAQLSERLGPASLTALSAADFAADRLAALPVAPVAPPAAATAVAPLAIVGGRFTAGGRVIFGDALESALWQGQLMPARASKMEPNPIRWAPGRTGPGLTEDLDELTDRMRAQGEPLFLMAPGLWYDRRRDSHFTGPQADDDVWAPFLEMPWARSGQGRAWDGLSKWDLTKFNPWYWDRIREFADLCARKGLIVVHHFYHNHNLEETPAHWTDYPWCEMNCVQQTGIPDPPPRHERTEYTTSVAERFYDVTNVEAREWHRLLFQHGFDVLQDEPNVIHTVSCEFAGPLEFQQFFLDTAAEWERAHRRRLHLALITSKAVTDAILADPVRAQLVDVIDMTYWQYLPDGRLFASNGEGRLAFRELRTNYFGKYDAPVPRGTPELVYRQVREYRDRFPDKAIVCGDAGQGPIPVLMAGGAAALISHDWPAEGRDDRAFLRFIEANLAEALPHMTPRDDLATGGTWCLADNGHNALFYSPHGATMHVKRPAASAGATSSWFNPRSGETSPAVPGGGLTIAKPSAEAWLLFVKSGTSR